jgi:hypothetical protein
MAAKYQVETACSTTSLQAGENLAATAAHTRSWLLLEFDGFWESKALEESSLPGEVKQNLMQAQKTLPAPRFLFIKGPSGRAQPPFHFYLIRTNEDQPKMYRFLLDRYEDLLDLDIPAVLSGDPRYEARAITDPFFTVCVNARRDPCCAHFGVPLYQKLVKILGQSHADWRVWQSTHVAGHRFAPNVLYFPKGLYFGRVTPDQAENLISSCLDDKLFLAYFRGRAEYMEPVQAAEIYLRRHTGSREIDAYSLTQVEESAEGVWLVRFSDRSSGAKYRIEIHKQTGDGRILQSCGQEDPPQTTFYELTHFEMEAS